MPRSHSPHLPPSRATLPHMKQSQVGMQILNVSSLTKIPNTSDPLITPLGDWIDINMYFDNRYGNMQPIFCFTVDVNNDEACVVKIDQAYALPIMNHFGEYDFNSTAFPKQCDWYIMLIISYILFTKLSNPFHACSDFVTDSSYCQVFDFMIGVIFFNTTSAYPIMELIGKYGVENINRLAYNISADAIESSLSVQDRAEAYRFCNLSFGPCNVSSSPNFFGSEGFTFG